MANSGNSDITWLRFDPGICVLRGLHAWGMPPVLLLLYGDGWRRIAWSRLGPQPLSQLRSRKSVSTRGANWGNEEKHPRAKGEEDFFDLTGHARRPGGGGMGNATSGSWEVGSSITIRGAANVNPIKGVGICVGPHNYVDGFPNVLMSLDIATVRKLNHRDSSIGRRVELEPLLDLVELTGVPEGRESTTSLGSGEEAEGPSEGC